MNNIHCLLVGDTRIGKKDQPLGLHTGLGWTLAESLKSSNEERAGIDFASLGY